MRRLALFDGLLGVMIFLGFFMNLDSWQKSESVNFSFEQKNFSVGEPFSKVKKFTFKKEEVFRNISVKAYLYSSNEYERRQVVQLPSSFEEKDYNYEIADYQWNIVYLYTSNQRLNEFIGVGAKYFWKHREAQKQNGKWELSPKYNFWVTHVDYDHTGVLSWPFDLSRSWIGLTKSNKTKEFLAELYRQPNRLLKKITITQDEYHDAWHDNWVGYEDYYLHSYVSDFEFEEKDGDDNILQKIFHKSNNASSNKNLLFSNIDANWLKFKIKKDISWFSFFRAAQEEVPDFFSANMHLILETPILIPFTDIEMRYDNKKIKPVVSIEHNKEAEEVEIQINGIPSSLNLAWYEKDVWIPIYQSIKPFLTLTDEKTVGRGKEYYGWVNQDLFLSLDRRYIRFERYENELHTSFTLAISSSYKLVYGGNVGWISYVSDNFDNAVIDLASNHNDSEYSYFNYDLEKFDSKLVKKERGVPREISRNADWSEIISYDEKLTFAAFKKIFKNAENYQKWLKYLQDRGTVSNELIKVEYQNEIERVVEESTVDLTGKGKLEWSYHWDNYQTAHEKVVKEFAKIVSVGSQGEEPNLPEPDKPDKFSKQWYQQAYFFILVVVFICLFLRIISKIILRKKEKSFH